MDPQDGALFLSHPVMIVTVVSITIDLILILLLIFGQVCYHVYGPLRMPLLPKNWARPLTLSSVIFANMLCQLLIVALSFPLYVNNIGAFSKIETCLMVRLFLANELARNWCLGLVSIHTLLAICKPLVLRRKVQFISWMIACILVWMCSLCFTFLVLIGENVSKQHENSVHAAICYTNVGIETFKIIHTYVPLACICLATLCSLCAAVRCSKRSEDTKWISDQCVTTMAFQIIITISFILMSVVGNQALNIAFYWLYVFAAMLLKDVREIILTFVCYTCCSWSYLFCKDDIRSVDEEMDMKRIKRKNGTKTTETVGIEEINIDESDETGIDIKANEHFEEDERQDCTHAYEAQKINEENKSENEFTKIEIEAFVSKTGQTDEGEELIQNKEEKKNISKISQKSISTSKMMRNEAKLRINEKKKKESNDESRSNEEDENEDDETIDADDENEERSDDDDNSNV